MQLSNLVSFVLFKKVPLNIFGLISLGQSKCTYRGVTYRISYPFNGCSVPQLDRDIKVSDDDLKTILKSILSTQKVSFSCSNCAFFCQNTKNFGNCALSKKYVELSENCGRFNPKTE